MKFLYEYRSSDNAIRRGEIAAPNRDAVFATLKSRGIRPSRVELAPGLLNRLSALGKRWFAIVVLCAMCLALCATALFFRGEAKSAEQDAQSTKHEAQSSIDLFDSPTRRQPIGDPAIIEKGIRTGWADVFADEGDRFLASFAIPGEQPAVRSIPVTVLEKCLEAPVGSHASRDRDSPDSIESRQIRAMVRGMKDELRQFLADGGSYAAYSRRLVARQDEEIACYNRVKTELEAASTSGMDSAALEALYEERNAALRNLGIRTIPMPE